VVLALGAVLLAILATGDDSQPAERRAERPPRSQPRVPPLAPPLRPAPRPRRDEKGYPRGTKREFASVCDERTPLDRGQCECVYDRLHDEYEYDEFRELIGRIDPEEGEVPPEILDHAFRCRLP
jgi:hypothetical protein